MRRFTLVTLIALFLMIAIASYFQIRAAQKPGRFPGPVHGTFLPATPTATG